MALFCIDLFSAKKWTLQTLELDNNKTIAISSHITSKKDPTYIFLPGIFRGANPEKNDVYLQQLSKEGKNWVAMDFSTQPSSIVKSKGTISSRDVDLNDLVREVTQLIDSLSIENPIIVSLSYSSSVATMIPSKVSEVIIETAPMVRQEDTKGLMRDLLESNNRLCANPFMAMTPFCIGWSYQKETAYKTYWATVVNGQKKVYRELEDNTLYNKSVDGYISMAKAVESFDLRDTNFKEGPRRIFILGEKEDPERLRLQKEVIKSYEEQTGEAPQVFIIKDAGHIVPFDQPTAYNTVLNRIQKNDIPEGHFFMVDSKGHFTRIPAL
jgi:pimeloyl-ACP methyl ester carboxylesterase